MDLTHRDSMNPDCALRYAGDFSGAFWDGVAVLALEELEASECKECVDAGTVHEHSRRVCRLFQHEQILAMYSAVALRSVIFAVLMHRS